MKGRAIDWALVVGLLVVAGAIVWTLFSLGGERRPTPPSNGESITSPSGNGVVPIAPDGTPANGPPAADGANGAEAGNAASPSGDSADGAASAGVRPLAPDAGGASDAGAASAAGAASDAGTSGPATGASAAGSSTGGSSTGGPASGRPDPSIPATAAPPVPSSGAAEIGRVGFSFVTGGAGACGIVLEPWTHVAVSRELLDAYGCGAEVTLTLDDEKDGRSRVQAIVADTMNEAFSRTVNVYVGQDEPALQYGLTAGTIELR